MAKRLPVLFVVALTAVVALGSAVNHERPLLSSASIALIIWLAFIAAFGGMLALIIRASRIGKLRADRAAGNPSRAELPELPIHTWTALTPGRVAAFQAPEGLPHELPRVMKALLASTQLRADRLLDMRSTVVDGQTVTTFDHAAHSGTDSSGSVRRTTYAWVTVELTFPFVYAYGRDGAWDELDHTLAQVKLEFDDFNRAFGVRSNNANAAIAFFSGRVMELMLAEPALRYVIAAGNDLLIGMNPSAGLPLSPGTRAVLDGMNLLAARSDPERSLRFAVAFTALLTTSASARP